MFILLKRLFYLILKKYNASHFPVPFNILRTVGYKTIKSNKTAAVKKCDV